MRSYEYCSDLVGDDAREREAGGWRLLLSSIRVGDSITLTRMERWTNESTSISILCIVMRMHQIASGWRLLEEM